MRRLLFVHNHPSRFVQLDLALLAERYQVREWYQRTRAVNLAALARAVDESDLVFGWFASWHTLFPALLASRAHRPVVLVVGGYDTANMPAIGYGSQRGGVKRWVARTTMHLATRIVTNSNYARDEAVSNAGVDAGRVTVVYHGLDVPDIEPGGKKENLIVTVGNIDRTTLARKGLESFVRAAAFLPDVPFLLIGAWRDDAINRLRAIASPNVRLEGWLDDKDLNDRLLRARAYVQASRHEGFGMAVAEAMLHECIPVVTRAGALPEVVGECGIYVESAEPAAVAEGVRRALAEEDTTGL
ncbi:MAG: glycosyltransferase family 4 protein, partial [Chloroflexi bacterium]|nr:glycosyltransferase family 4 protein [Chloroflexota bacterium]